MTASILSTYYPNTQKELDFKGTVFQQNSTEGLN